MKMNRENREALKEFLSGGRFVFGFVVLNVCFVAFVLNYAANWLEAQPTPQEQRFKVVDRYENRCDVVQYNPNGSARYSYFLDCK
jgi:hypothetical protein